MLRIYSAFLFIENRMYKSKYGRKNAKIKKIGWDFYLLCKCGAKMWIQFSVTSFLSFKGEVILSLSTNKDDSHNENLLSYKNERILPSVAIAGKSNLHKAMSAAIRMICWI